MNGRKAQIGFSQRIRLEWFEQTANLILAGNDKTAINDALQELLRDTLSVGGKAVRGNREKVITILLKTWLTVPFELVPLRNEGLKILRGISREDRVAMHWGMAMAVYPFWGSVAAHVGRLLRLQGSVAASQVQRRIKEDYGDRDTASRAARRVLRSFIDWGVLNETGDKGIYGQGKQYPIEDPRRVAWMVEASLHARQIKSTALKDLLDGPNLFPFRLARVSPDQLSPFASRLDILRHGSDDDLVMRIDAVGVQRHLARR